MESRRQLLKLVISQSTVIIAQLRMGGFRHLELQTRVADGGSQVLATLREETPHAVIIKAELGDTDAFSLCRRIRTELGLGQLPVIVLCNHGITRPMLPAIEASGCNEVFTIPLGHAQLYDIITSHLELPRRRSTRVRLRAQVAARGKKGETLGELHDISLTGARVRLGGPFLEDGALAISIANPPDQDVEVNGTVVWRRPHGLGTELALQFTEASVEVAAQIGKLLTWRVEPGQTRQRVVLHQRLDEHSSFEGLVEQLEKKNLFDLRHLSHITSQGILHWVNFLRQIPSEVDYCFCNCSVPFCTQAAYLPGMLGRGRLLSFFAPYFCPDCDHEMEQELVVAHLGDPRAPTLPPVTCLICGTTMELDTTPESFLAMLQD